MFSSLLDSVASEVKGQIEWPREWVVFAPFDRANPVPEDHFFRSVPGVISTEETSVASARTAAARRMKVEPGMPVDLADLFEAQVAGNVAYIFLELESPVAQVVTLGMGADWWLQVWLNGEAVFDTLELGNNAYPPTMLDHQVDVTLGEGLNILAIRFISGRASSLMALGGPREFPAAQRRQEVMLSKRGLNVMPERLEDRLLFPVREQAVAMARKGLQLPVTDASLSAGGLAGLQPMPKRQLYFVPPREQAERVPDRRGELRDTLQRRFDEPVRIRLSKGRYPWEDRHLDAIVWTTPADEDALPDGNLEVLLKDADGEVLARHRIDDLSASGLFFSVGFPPALEGRAAALEVIWLQNGDEVGRSEAEFNVNARRDVAVSGRIPLSILNEPGATIVNAPMTVGVPFPRGALGDPDTVRLVDADGAELPLQTRELARWSRFGPVKWLLCDFTVDLDGEPREVYLEYGPDIRRTPQPDITTGLPVAGFPALNTGRIRIDEGGLSFDATGSGRFQPVLDSKSLLGAFVQHEDARTYTMPVDAEYAFEELGSEKVVVRRTGWYAEPESGREFCQFVTRFIFFRDSPVVRIFHTWIFTGDGNSDRIANMGWRFSSAGPVQQGAILADFDSGEWIATDSLVQFDYNRFLLPATRSEVEGRSAGVLSGVVGPTRVAFGAKDFWQNFPSELEIGADDFVFYNWPRRNPPARFERPVQRGDAFRSRFAHEGELLDFSLPDEYASGPIWRESSSSEGHIAENSPESVNAQGIARTEEMFLYLADASVPPDEAAKVLQGLNDETLRAIVDPVWVSASGVFGEIHHYDPENYPEAERVFDLSITAPARWVEQLGFYGMWLHGDYPGWGINLRDRTVSTYRTLRKNHHNYPIGWAPFARSGNPQMLKLAEKAVRQMTDANFCHYATADVDDLVGASHFRRQGWWDRSLLPWAGRSGPHVRSYTVDCDYLWHAYYMTGYTRARDVALLFGELTQHDHFAPASSQLRPRITQSMMPSYIDMYQATFDPWFLASALEIADMHEYFYADLEPMDWRVRYPHDSGHTWRHSEQQLFDFTGSDIHRHMALNNAAAWSSLFWSKSAHHSDWGGGNPRLATFAWSQTGDDLYLARAVAGIDRPIVGMYDGDLDYSRGIIGNAIGHGYLPLRSPQWDDVGRVLYAVEQAGKVPEPLHDTYPVSGRRIGDATHHGFILPDVLIRKNPGEAVPLYLDAPGRGRDHGSVWPEPRYGAYSYSVADQQGDVYMEGSWNAPDRVVLPADAPAGIYQVNLSALLAYPDDEYLQRRYGDRGRFQRIHSRINLPVAEPDVPEILVFDTTAQGTQVPAPGMGFWFMVPEGTESFWIEFGRSGVGSAPVTRVSVWDPDGGRAYDLSYSGDPPPRIEIEVLPEHAGKLWRATGGPFNLDPQIPPYFSFSGRKWFDPEE